MKSKLIIYCMTLLIPLAAVSKEADQLRDPFVPIVLEQAAQKKLDDFPLDALKAVGTMREGSQAVVTIRDPNNQLYCLKIGDKVGVEKAKIVGITEDEIRVTWLMQGQVFTEHLAIFSEDSSL